MYLPLKYNYHLIFLIGLLRVIIRKLTRFFLDAGCLKNFLMRSRVKVLENSKILLDEVFLSIYSHHLNNKNLLGYVEEKVMEL